MSKKERFNGKVVLISKEVTLELGQAIYENIGTILIGSSSVLTERANELRADLALKNQKTEICVTSFLNDIEPDDIKKNELDFCLKMKNVIDMIHTLKKCTPEQHMILYGNKLAISYLAHVLDHGHNPATWESNMEILVEKTADLCRF